MNSKDLAALEKGLTDFGWKFYYIHDIGSTNDWAREECLKGMDEPAVFLTALQTNGRGRLGRSWTAEEGASLTFSTVVSPECSFSLAPAYTEVFGLAVCIAIRKLTGCDALIKWPNDIVISGKKVCGILTEAVPGKEQIIIGTGINLKEAAYPEDLAFKAISLEEVCRTVPDISLLITEIIKGFEKARKVFLEKKSMAGLKEAYEKLLVNIGRTTTVTEQGLSVSGRAKGIDDEGRLIFEKEDGETVRIFSGEASVSGIY